jgi:hypothetical protein
VFVDNSEAVWISLPLSLPFLGTHLIGQSGRLDASNWLIVPLMVAVVVNGTLLILQGVSKKPQPRNFPSIDIVLKTKDFRRLGI